MLPPALLVGPLFLHLLVQSGYHHCCHVHLVLAFGSACDVRMACVGHVLRPDFVRLVLLVQLVLTLNVFGIAAPARTALALGLLDVALEVLAP